ncbi:MAG: ATP-binding cassette domain-containing protein [Myxococcales bacterium]|nr:ATP-binding cassette domain-containing protein [Myxococcales bacterium]
MDVRRGEVLGLVGGSGAGKTVLMRHMILLYEPAGGSVKLFGQETSNLSDARAAELRRRFGVMFQQGALFGGLTVLQNVAVPLKEHTDLSPADIEEVAMLKIGLSGLPALAAHKYPRELSGGMLKRAAVARAIALDPDLLFLDEPSAGLDPVSAAKLDDLIAQLSESLGLTVVLVSHDLDSLWRVTTRIAFLGEKKILAEGTMLELSKNPHPIIQEYFGGPRGRAAGQANES